MDHNLYYLIKITKMFFALWIYKCLAVHFDITFAKSKKKGGGVALRHTEQFEHTFSL